METAYNSPTLDRDICRRARLSRDARFDGEFFLGVKTTGIYCRPICPARAPAEKNVLYFSSAAQAAKAGFRPCLRCRPESAPNSPAWRGTSATVSRALSLIDEGALAAGTLPQLAQRLGVGERYLRKLFQRELGISPQALALNLRLLFAKKLLAETTLPVTEVAYAAGFGSVRRFNSAVLQHFKLSPTDLRRQAGKRTGASRVQLSGIQLQLHYRPPYDWQGVIRFFARHAVEGVEQVDGSSYQREISLADSKGWFRVQPLPGKHTLSLELQLDDQRLLMQAVTRVRRMFDLDANPASIQQALAGSPLAPLLREVPGIRAPGTWSLFEAALRAVVGQQVSTRAARSVHARLASACDGQFADAARLAALPDKYFPMPGKRRDTVKALCNLYRIDHAEPELDDIAALAGVGPWTTAMVAMRGAGHPDSFPHKDLGLLNAWKKLTGDDQPGDQLDGCRPWRSYAANLLWRSLGS